MIKLKYLFSFNYSGVPNRSAGTYAEFRLKRVRYEKFFYLLFKT